jgi:hypothetical protein
MSRIHSLLLAPILGCLVVWASLLMPCLPAWAGPVEWHEVAATSEGRQWWDSGSLRTNKSGNLTLLSRYQSIPQSTAQPIEPSQSTDQSTAQSTAQSTEAIQLIEQPNKSQEQAAKQPNKIQGQATQQSPRAKTDLYVMEIDCGQRIYRDTSINGIPQFNATWLPSGGDQLIDAVLSEACSAASPGA